VLGWLESQSEAQSHFCAACNTFNKVQIDKVIG